MNVFFNKLLVINILCSSIFSLHVFIQTANAAPPTPEYPATIHVPKGYVDSTIQSIRFNEDGTPNAIGQKAISQKAIKVIEDNDSVISWLPPDGGFIEKGGKKIAEGKAEIRKQLEEWKEEQKNQPPQLGEKCLISPHYHLQDLGEDKIQGTPDDIFEYAENVYGKDGSIKFDKGTPFTKTSPQNFANQSGGEFAVERNGHKIAIGVGNKNAQLPGSDGKYYTVTGSRTVVADEYGSGEEPEQPDCVFDKDDKGAGKPEDPANGVNPYAGLGDNGGGGGNGGGGNGGGGLFGGGGGAGGLGALLPLLMQGLMGGGQQGQQGQGQGQNPYGAGYGNQQQDCATQPIAPVCGMDGKTYNNQCYLNQFGVILRSTGVCVQAVTPTPTPNISNVVTLEHLSKSGIPATLLENVRNLVSSVLSSILAGTNVTETVVR